MLCVSFLTSLRFLFDPFDLDVDITPETVRQAIAKNECTKSIVMSLKYVPHDTHLALVSHHTLPC
jgi:hypothetical protein